MISRTGAYALTVEDPEKTFNFHQIIKFGVDQNSKMSMKDIFIDSYISDVVIEARNECNNTCTDAEYESFLEVNFIAWLKGWDTGLGYYKGTLNPNGTYNWVRIN